MRIVILGSGLMARGAVHDYLANDAVESVTVTDISQSALDELTSRFDDERLLAKLLDVNDLEAVREVLRESDGVFSAIHYRHNVELSRIAIETGTNMVDLGGNNDIVQGQLALSDEAAAAGVSIVPDCGLAPGMASMLVAWGMHHFDWVDTVQIRVGGLPLNPVEPLCYERLFSVEGLINEYVEPPLFVRDGKLIVGQPLGDVEVVEFDEPLGTLEAFNTSGGVSTLPDSYKDRLRNLDYKTLRYPGHALAMRWMLELGLFDGGEVEVDGVMVSPRRLVGAQIENNVPLAERDRAVVRVNFSGTDDDGGYREHRLQIIDEFDERTQLTAMMRTTAFPAAIVSQMQCTGTVSKVGVFPQEAVLDPDAYVNELLRRGIPLDGVVDVHTGAHS